MPDVLVAPARTSAADWLALAGATTAIVLALLTLGLALARPRRLPGAAPETPARGADPVLLVSAAVVILLALAAWLLR
jgi:hypothetical protein